MEFKMFIRVGIGVLACLLFFYGYQAQKSFEKTKEPVIDFRFRAPKVKGYRYDPHFKAYPTIDDKSTIYPDDPGVWVNTTFLWREDENEQDSTAVFEEDILAREAWERKKMLLDRILDDEFKVEGKVFQNRTEDDSRHVTDEDAYDGEIPSRYWD